MRWLLGAAGLVVLALAAGFAWINLVGHDPAVWHVDPTQISRSPSPNDFLAAPPGATDQPVDRETAVHPVPPEQLLEAFREIALAEPRTRIVAETPDQHLLTLVQRTPVIGFPDYVSVRAIEVARGEADADPQPGSALVVWSRSRFGAGDFGVNAARVNRWLDRLEPDGSGEPGPAR